MRLLSYDCRSIHLYQDLNKTKQKKTFKKQEIFRKRITEVESFNRKIKFSYIHNTIPSGKKLIYFSSHLRGINNESKIQIGNNFIPN